MKCIISFYLFINFIKHKACDILTLGKSFKDNKYKSIRIDFYKIKVI